MWPDPPSKRVLVPAAWFHPFIKGNSFFPSSKYTSGYLEKRKNSVFFQGFVPNWENSAWEQFGVTSAGGNWSFGEKAAPSTSLSPIISLLSGWEAPKVQLSPLCLSKLPAARKYIGRNDPEDALIWFIPQYSLRPGHRQGTPTLAVTTAQPWSWKLNSYKASTSFKSQPKIHQCTRSPKHPGKYQERKPAGKPSQYLGPCCGAGTNPQVGIALTWVSKSIKEERQGHRVKG